MTKTEYILKNRDMIIAFLHNELKKQNISLDKFAKQLDVRHMTLCKWLEGRTVPKISNVFLMAKKLGYKLVLVKKTHDGAKEIDNLSLASLISFFDEKKREIYQPYKELKRIYGDYWHRPHSHPKFDKAIAILNTCGYDFVVRKLDNN